MLLRFYLSLLGFLLFSPVGQSQQKITWEHLSDLRMDKSEVHPEYGIVIEKPIFGELIKAYEGKEVYVSGYLIPVDASGKAYVISKNPQASCFFCGEGGPESVVEIEWMELPKKRLETDSYISLKGRLRLNPDDLNRMIYILESAKPL